jgi:hypothetical protein
MVDKDKKLLANFGKFSNVHQLAISVDKLRPNMRAALEDYAFLRLFGNFLEFC